MKLYQLTLLIISVALTQTSVFYLNLGGFGVNWVLILAWILYLNYTRDDAFYMAFFGGLLSDLLRLEGLGITSFSLLIPLLIFLAFDLSVKLKETPLKYLALFLGIAISHMLIILASFIFGDISTLEAGFIQSQVVIVVAEWLIISTFTAVREIFFPDFVKYS